MRWYWKLLIGVLATIILGANALFTWVDRTPYKDTLHYQQTLSSLNRYYEYRTSHLPDSLSVGWSSQPLLPSVSEMLELAGYGARDPKAAIGIHDSVSVKAFVITNGQQKIALVSAELLIIHPEVRQQVYKALKNTNWIADEIYFGATHSHSSIGGWAPGLVGDLFAGTYQADIVQHLGNQIAKSITEAETGVQKGHFSFAELHAPDFVRNRLVGQKGQKDDLVKTLIFEHANGKAIDISYGAHATCLGHQWKKVSGDYPAMLVNQIIKDSLYNFASYRAGAVASMGTGRNGTKDLELAKWMASGLVNEIEITSRLMPAPFHTSKIESYKIPFYLGDPQLKVSTNLSLRPWLFRQLVGEYPVDISVASFDQLLMIGLPCDFSGELALPLYAYAKSKGLTLIINSFNGGYIGYIPHDKWYDLNKYETRTMAWYGHDMGAYTSEIIRKIIDQHAL